MSDEPTTTAGRSQIFAGYIRVSRVGERDERLRSPEFQRSAIAVKAAAAGVPVEMFEPELDVSGSKRSRAILDAIVARIEAGELAGIIVYNLSRLSRLAPRDRVELVERIESAGGRILSASESFDASTPEGRFQRELFFSIARMQWEQASEGFAAAKAAAIEAGRPIMRTIPFGYRQAERGAPLELEPLEAELVVELYRRRVDGASFGELLELFERETGRRSYRQTIRYMLENRTYLGELHYGREVELVNAAAHPAIVDPELFAAVQRVNGERSARQATHGGRAKALLAGIACCESCGRGLVRTQTGSARRYAYKCPADARHCAARAHIGADELEALVVERVLEWAGATADDVVELELERDGDARAIAERRVGEAERRLREWAGDLELEERDEQAYREGLEARVQRLELRREELEALGAADELEVARGSVRDVLASDAYPVADRRALLSIVVAAVVVRRTPRRGAPAVERADVMLTADVLPAEHASELVEQPAA